MSDDASAGFDQSRIWHHYQNDSPEVFANAGPRLDRVAREVLRRCGRGGKVLTIGIGDGYLERRLQQLGSSVHALDPDQAVADRLIAEGFDARAGRLEMLPYESQSFDAVVASEVLEHLAPAEGRQGMSEVARVLRSGRWFIGTVPFREELRLHMVVCPHCGEVFHRWGHQRAFDENDIRRDLDPHFDVVKVDHRAFVSLRGRSALRMVTGLGVLALGRIGSPLAFPSIFFVARKRERGRS